MRLIVAAVGRLKAGPERQLAERYRERAAQLGRGIGLRDIELVEIAESRNRDAGRRMIEERESCCWNKSTGQPQSLLDILIIAADGTDAECHVYVSGP